MINGHTVNGSAVNAASTTVNFVVEDVLETAVVLGYDDVPLIVTVDHVDSDVITDTTYPASYAPIYETAVVTSAASTFSITSTLSDDPAVVTDSVDGDRTSTIDIVDPAEFSDLLEATRQVVVDVTDSAVVVSYSDQSEPAGTVYETAVVSDNTTVSRVANLLVTDSAVLSDETFTSTVADLAESAVVTSSATPLRSSYIDLTDSAVVTGAADLAGSGLQSLDLVDTAVVEDSTVNQLVAKYDVVEEAFLDSSMVSAEGLAGIDGYDADSVWTASVASWGMSRHSGDGITQRSGVYAVSPSGLYSVGSTGHAASLQTGTTDFGSKVEKRMSHLYVQGERSGTLTLTVTADFVGAAQTESYTPITGTDQTSARNARFDVGRGFKSVYYGITIATTDDAELYGMEALVEPMRRRVG